MWCTQNQQLLYIEAANKADQRDWLTRIETNITKVVYLVRSPADRYRFDCRSALSCGSQERLRCPAAQPEHCPPDTMFGETVLLCCPAVLSKGSSDEQFGPPQHGKLLLLSRSLVFEVLALRCMYFISTPLYPLYKYT